jgi:hypothetical protein
MSTDLLQTYSPSWQKDFAPHFDKRFVPVPSCGDRFISHRNCSQEMFNNYDTKSEIFSQNSQINLLDKLGSHTSQIMEENNENNMNQSNSMQGDENQRMYTTLLQNQVLGI